MLSKVTLGPTDLRVSRLCYGTNMFGTAIDQDRANAILDRFAGLGGNFIDTARSYGDWIPDAPSGASERTIGAWLKGKQRADFVIATKGGFFDLRAGDFRNRATPDDIRQDLAESLDHLGVKTIDLFWLHADNPEAPVGPIIDMLIEAKRSGKIRWFGASNWTADRVLAANKYAKGKGSEGFVAIQPFWGLAKPDSEAAMQQGYVLHYEENGGALHDSGLAVVPYCAQSRGYFTKLDRDGPSGLPEALAAFYDHPVNAARMGAVKRVAARRSASVNDVVLAYLLNQPQQTIPIFGSSSAQQLEDSVKAADLVLSPEELAELRAG